MKLKFTRPSLGDILKAVITEMPIHYLNEINTNIESLTIKASTGARDAFADLSNFMVNTIQSNWGRSHRRLRSGISDFRKNPFESTLVAVASAFPLTGMFAGLIIGQWNDDLGKRVYKASGQGYFIRALDETSNILFPNWVKDNLDSLLIDPLDSMLECAWSQCHSWMTGYDKRNKHKPNYSGTDIKITNDGIYYKDKAVATMRGVGFIAETIQQMDTSSAYYTSRVFTTFTRCLRCHRSGHVAIACTYDTTKGGTPL